MKTLNQDCTTKKKKKKTYRVSFAWKFPISVGIVPSKELKTKFLEMEIMLEEKEKKIKKSKKRKQECHTRKCSNIT